MKIKPVNGNVLLHAIVGSNEYEQAEKAGFYIPDQAKQKGLPNVGIVAAIDPAIKCDFKVGDKVLYNRHVQQFEMFIMPDGKNLTQIKASEIFAVLTDE